MGLYLERRVNGGFLRYRFGGLIHGGAYFRNFTVGYAKFGVGAGGGVIYACNLGGLWLQDSLVGFFEISVHLDFYPRGSILCLGFNQISEICY